MKTAKREHRKPDMQIFRPRMSLQNKNFKIEDHSVRSNTNDSLEHSKYQSFLNNPQVNTFNEHTDRTTNLISEVSKTSKDVKNRRPDIQIYVPKPKLVAHLNEKKLDSRVSGSQTGLKNDVKSKSSCGKMSSLTPNVNKVQISSKKTHSELEVKQSSTKHSESNSSLRTEYWTDLVEDSGSSNSRSTPDNCNGYVDNTSIHTFQNEEVEKKSGSILNDKEFKSLIGSQDKENRSKGKISLKTQMKILRDSILIELVDNVQNNFEVVDHANLKSYESQDLIISSLIQNMGYIPPPHSPDLEPQFYMCPAIADNFITPPVLSPVPDNFIPPPVPFPVPDYFIAPPVPCPVQNYFLAPSVPCSVPDDFIAPPVPLPDIYLHTVYNHLPEPGSKKLKPIIEKNLENISLLEKELSILLADGFGGTNLNAVKLCRYKLQLHYETIFLADPEYCAERNPEQCLWRSSFYQIIELLRNKLDDSSQDKEETRTNLLKIISESTIFYENLIEKQQETYGFNLASILKDSKDMTSMSEKLSLVLISTQKILILLGDLARYKEEASQTAYYGKARSWYNKAQQIGPESGIPYYQLAALALKTRRKLDVAYYYIKSLTAGYPVLFAKEDLLSLFGEAKRKYENKQKQEAPYELKVFDEKIIMCHKVWIKPEGSSNQQPAKVDLDSSDVEHLSDVELNKRFITSFLHVHGKLFTNVGMETFSDTLTIMLNNFYNLIQRSPLPITSFRLLQLLTINMFSVENSSKENNHDGSTSLLQDQALNTSMLMMSLLTSRCQILESMHKLTPNSSNQISDDLDQMLSCKKIWISCQKSLV